MKKKFIWFVSITLVFFLLVMSILFYQYLKTEVNAQEKDLLNQIFNSEVNCNTPCWKGLTPMKSGEADYENLAANLEENGLFFRYTSTEDESTVYSWFDPENETYFFISLDGQKLVQRIYYRGFILSSLDNLFKVLSEPDYYASELRWDIHEYVTLDLLYLEEGVVISFLGLHPDQVSEECLLDLSNWETIQINLVKSNSPEKMLEDSLNSDYSLKDPTQPWDGLDKIRVQNCVPTK